jgi:hypothetical protein
MRGPALACGLVLALAASIPAVALDIPDVTYPALPGRAASAEGFVPAGWLLEKQRTGDLNRDGAADLVLVLKQNDPKNVLPNKDGLGRAPFDTNPRILAVAFADKAGGFSLALQNHTLIRRPDNPAMDDVLAENGDVTIQRGTLRVSLHLFMSAGGWGMSITHLTFRHQNGRFELIGFDSDTIQRNTGELLKTSINYSTRVVIQAVGSIENDRMKTKRSTLPKRPLKALDELGDGLDFDPEK